LERNVLRGEKWPFMAKNTGAFAVFLPLIFSF